MGYVTVTPATATVMPTGPANFATNLSVCTTVLEKANVTTRQDPVSATTVGKARIVRLLNAPSIATENTSVLVTPVSVIPGGSAQLVIPVSVGTDVAISRTRIVTQFPECARVTRGGLANDAMLMIGAQSGKIWKMDKSTIVPIVDTATMPSAFATKDSKGSIVLVSATTARMEYSAKTEEFVSTRSAIVILDSAVSIVR